MVKPCISVIVPVYNVKSLLPRCIDSLLDQTYVDFELLLIDDGSTDGSGDVCDEYKKQDHRMYLQTVVTQYFANNKSEIWS